MWVIFRTEDGNVTAFQTDWTAGPLGPAVRKAGAYPGRKLFAPTQVVTAHRTTLVEVYIARDSDGREAVSHVERWKVGPPKQEAAITRKVDGRMYKLARNGRWYRVPKSPNGTWRPVKDPEVIRRLEEK